ncbi:carboxypeptidase regulatory-like domain-containing protein [Candidatus Woesearchaeota archaeon]|nr:carboxypeptidase regulatory-like domain-containing protein [Candidatus Woesearchaeota archaeon]
MLFLILILIVSSLNFVVAFDADAGPGDSDPGGDPGGDPGSTQAGGGSGTSTGTSTGTTGTSGGGCGSGCGDGVCGSTYSESYESYFCGDSICTQLVCSVSGSETCSSCSADCGSCCVSNAGQPCGACGYIDCSGNCVNQGQCFPGQTNCLGDIVLGCNSFCQWGPVQDCNSLDAWYGGGNTQTATCGSVDNDASSEYRNYGCSAGSCTYSVTQTQDCDSSDAWLGGGNTAGCGTDPNSVWYDYYVTTNTNSCTSTTTCTGTGSVNCDSSDICNNKCEGTIFVSVPPMKDYYVTTNSNSCTSTTDSPVTEDCATKSSADSDGSSTAYTVAGTVTDYSTCTLTGCTGTAYSDSCSGTVLTEYGASGASFTSSAYDCQNYETNYCSNDRYFRQEWGCGATPAYCHNDFAVDTAIGTNADGDAKDKECGDSLCDNAAGVFDSTKTTTETACADGLDNDCDGKKDCADSDCAALTGPSGVRCCQTASNCVQSNCVAESCVSNACSYSSRNACDATECAAGTYCDAAGGTCKSPDENSNVCLNCASDQTPSYTWSWSISKFEDAGKAYGAELFNSNNAGCTAESGGVCFDNTGKTDVHKAALTTGNCCGDDPNEFYKSDYYGPECVSSLNDCVWSTGDAQLSDSGNPAWWCYLGKWDECTKAAHLGKHFGSVACAGTGTGWTLNPLPESNYSCTDGLDNDGDGLVDCADSDCDGSISGTVKNQDNEPIANADVSAKKNLTTVKSATTSQQGNYSISPISCGNYSLVVSHPDYVPNTKTIALSSSQQATLDFNLASGTSCEADCTYASGNIVYAACDNKNNCTFYDAISKAACDNSQPGWLRDYNSTYYVACASGAPQPKTEIQASVSCASGTLVKVTRIVVYNGKPVKLVVATCG